MRNYLNKKKLIHTRLEIGPQRDPCVEGGMGRKKNKITVPPQTERVLMGKNKFSLKCALLISLFLGPSQHPLRCTGEARFSSTAPLEHQPSPHSQLPGHSSDRTEVAVPGCHPGPPAAWCPGSPMTAYRPEPGNWEAEGWTRWDLSTDPGMDA